MKFSVPIQKSIGFEKNTNGFDRYLQEFSFFLQIPRHTCGGWVPTAIADAAAKPTADADAQRGHTADDTCQRLVCVSDCVGVGPATHAVRLCPAAQTSEMAEGLQHASR